MSNTLIGKELLEKQEREDERKGKQEGKKLQGLQILQSNSAVERLHHENHWMGLMTCTIC